MKTLVVYYSRTGNTKKIAQEIAKKLKADVEEIKDLNENLTPEFAKFEKNMDETINTGKEPKIDVSKNIPELITYSMGVVKAMLGIGTRINTTKDPAQYELVIIGSPVWCGKIPPAPAAYLKKNKNQFQKTAYFNTRGTSNLELFAEMEKISNKKPEATLIISRKEINTRKYSGKINDFVKKLNK